MSVYSDLVMIKRVFDRCGAQGEIRINFDDSSLTYRGRTVKIKPFCTIIESTDNLSDLLTHLEKLSGEVECEAICD